MFFCVFYRYRQEKTTYAAVFRGGKDSYLQVVKLDSWNFDSKTLTTETLDHMKGSTTYDIYDVDPRHAPKVSDITLSPTEIWAVRTVFIGLCLDGGYATGALLGRYSISSVSMA